MRLCLQLAFQLILHFRSPIAEQRLAGETQVNSKEEDDTAFVQSSLQLLQKKMEKTSAQKVNLLTLKGRNSSGPLAGCSGFECLSRYVALADKAYSWKDTGEKLQGVDKETAVSWTGHVLSLTSLVWRTPGDDEDIVWTHKLVIVVPANRNTTTADWCNLWIGGDGDEMEHATFLAAHTGALTAALFDVVSPTNPVSLSQAVATELNVSKKDVTNMGPDFLKSLGWQMFLRNPNRPDWLVELPILKAVVRAIDTVVAFTNESQVLSGGPVKRFGVAGISKRGIAAYMVGALDKRVKAIAPVDHPTNYRSNYQQQLASYGTGETTAWAMAGFYVRFKLFANDEEHDKLFSIVDPYYWTDRLTVPKFNVQRTGDKFFILGNTDNWYPQLPQEKHYRMIPGQSHAQHDISATSYAGNTAAFFENVMLGEAVPVIDWDVDRAAGTITVHQVSDHKPVSVTLWHAQSWDNRTRDFTNGFLIKVLPWTSSEVSANATQAPDGRTWKVSVAAPTDGRWTASFLSLEYKGLNPHSGIVSLSSEVLVLPNTYPFPSSAPTASPTRWALSMLLCIFVRHFPSAAH